MANVTFTPKNGDGTLGIAKSLTIVSAGAGGDESSASLPAGVASPMDGRAVPSSSALGLGGAAALGVFLASTNGSSTFQSGGVLQAYFYDPVVLAWGRIPEWDLPVLAGALTQAFAPRKIEAAHGYIVYLPAAVGCDVTITLTARYIRI